MDESRLSAIKARVSAAAPRPWAAMPLRRECDHPTTNVYTEQREVHGHGADIGPVAVACEAEFANGDFIAHAREDVEDLVAEVERLTALHAERDAAERTHASAYAGAVSRREEAERERDEARATRATDALSALAAQAKEYVRAYQGDDEDTDDRTVNLVLWRDLNDEGAPWQAGLVEEGGMGEVPILCGNSAADPEQAVANFRADLLIELAAHGAQGGES